MENINDREDDRSEDSHIGCVSVQSPNGPNGTNTHWVKSEDLPKLHHILENEFQRCQTLQQPKVSNTSSGISLGTDSDMYKYKTMSSGSVSSITPLSQLTPLDSATLTVLGTGTCDLLPLKN